MDANSIISRAAQKAKVAIVEATLQARDFYKGEPKRLKEINREMFNELTPASEMILKLKYGDDLINRWKQKMALTGKGNVNAI